VLLVKEATKSGTSPAVAMKLTRDHGVVVKDVANKKVRKDPESNLQEPTMVMLRRPRLSFNSSRRSQDLAQLILKATDQNCDSCPFPNLNEEITSCIQVAEKRQKDHHKEFEEGQRRRSPSRDKRGTK